MTTAPSAFTLQDDQGGVRKVQLGQELASGGAGAVYAVEGHTDLVIKIYHPATLQAHGGEYEARVAAMLQHPPALSNASASAHILAWPQAMARNASGQFCGFAMPALDFAKTESLEALLQPRQAESLGLPHHLAVRMTVAANLALIIAAIHRAGHFVVDMKPVNLRFYRRELYAAVLDCDGFAIQMPQQQFVAPQATPEYLAPEYQGAPVSIPEAQDRFALAVIIFRLLNFGIHPFDGVPVRAGMPNERAQRIAQHLYAYGSQPHPDVRPLASSAHECFPLELRQMFDAAFATTPPMRPAAAHWVRALLPFARQGLGLLHQDGCAHWWFKTLPCGECHRQNALQQHGQNSAHSPQLQTAQKIWKEVVALSPPRPYPQIHVAFHQPSASKAALALRRNGRLLLLQRFAALALAIGFNVLQWPHSLLFYACVFWLILPWGGIRMLRFRYALWQKKRATQRLYVQKKEVWEKTVGDHYFDQLSRKLDVLHDALNTAITQFDAQKNELVEQIYAEQLDLHLQNTTLERGCIQGIGPVLIATLNQHGIYTAYDIEPGTINEIEGLGETRQARLLEWREMAENDFVWDSVYVRSNHEYQRLEREATRTTGDYAHAMKQQLEHLRALVNQLNAQRAKLAPNLEALAAKLAQFEADEAALRWRRKL